MIKILINDKNSYSLKMCNRQINSNWYWWNQIILSYLSYYVILL